MLLRAPGWPLGPGDPEAALPEAQAAARLAPDYPPNQLVLGEARPWTPAPVISNSFGFGGHNGCVILGPA